MILNDVCRFSAADEQKQAGREARRQPGQAQVRPPGRRGVGKGKEGLPYCLDLIRVIVWCSLCFFMNNLVSKAHTSL